MEKELKSNIFEIIDANAQLIKFNQDKIPEYYLSDDYYEDTIESLNKGVYKGDLLKLKYYDLLDRVGKLINKYNIDISCIKKSTVNKINDHHRLNALKKVCFCQLEDKIDETDDYNDETGDDNDKPEDEIDETDDDNDEKNIKNNEEDHKTKEIIIGNKNIGSNITDDLHIMLKKVIISNYKELMNNAIKLMNTLLKTSQENNINTSTNQENNINNITTSTNQEININTSTAYVNTPEWIKVKKCTINLKNNKKVGNESFKYAIVTSKTSGVNRGRLKNIEKYIKDFVFEGIYYPPKKEDYETFQNNNPSTKLTIFKTK